MVIRVLGYYYVCNRFFKYSKKIMWGITCYFNPSKYQRRYDNYQVFRKNIKLPLIVVELAINEEPFVLENDENLTIVQVRTESIMWHKERLLNIAVSHLPKTCEKVCWLDCDIVFKRFNWVQQTELALDRYDVVHPYEFVEYQNNKGQVAKKMRYLRNEMWGLCCAMRVEKLKEIGGFYDACIIGGGDNVFGVALGFGMLDRDHYSPEHLKHINTYLSKNTTKKTTKYTYIEGTITHLWHGTTKNRQYIERYEILKTLRYNPDEVIESRDNNQPYRYSPKYFDNYNKILKYYFDSRKEDNADK